MIKEISLAMSTSWRRMFERAADILKYQMRLLASTRGCLVLKDELKVSNGKDVETKPFIDRSSSGKGPTCDSVVYRFFSTCAMNCI